MIDDPDETEGRRMYRESADALARSQIAMAKRTVKMTKPEPPSREESDDIIRRLQNVVPGLPPEWTGRSAIIDAMHRLDKLEIELAAWIGRYNAMGAMVDAQAERATRLRQVLLNVKIAEVYDTLRVGVIADDGASAASAEVTPLHQDVFRLWWKERNAALGHQ